MKIISKPDVSDWKYKHTCIICETVMEADQSDVKCQYHEAEGDGPYYSPAYYEYYVHCPTCDEKHDVSEEQIPKLLQVEFKKRAPPMSYR